MATAVLPQVSLFSIDPPVSEIAEASSLSSKAMLCTLSIGVWSGYKYDPEASDEIAEIHGADKDSGRFNKRLVPRKDLKEITAIVGRARRNHEFMTLPWTDQGYRVLPAAAYLDHAATMRIDAADFKAAVSRLIARFEDLVTKQCRLGTLFRVGDYPGMRDENGILRFAFPNELRERFSFETKVLPLPDADDFRVSLGNQDRERIKRQIAETIRASLRVGAQDLWQRLYRVVAHMSARMAEYNLAEAGNKPKLYDSMITNIVEIVDMLPKLNIAGDAELDRMAREIREALVVDPKQLRKSQIMQSDTAKAAADITLRMSAYMGAPTTAQEAIS